MKLTFQLISVPFLMVAFLSISSCAPKPEEIITTFVTGEVSRRHTEIDGKKEGKMIEYYIDGKIKAEMEFKNDLQIGKSVIYYPSGKIKQVQFYENGNINGPDTIFYENGKPQFLRTFAAGIKDGYIRKWNENDSIIYEARFDHDKLIEVKGEKLYPDTSGMK